MELSPPGLGGLLNTLERALHHLRAAALIIRQALGLPRLEPRAEHAELLARLTSLHQPCAEGGMLRDHLAVELGCEVS